jgi:hypothetical protein
VRVVQTARIATVARAGAAIIIRVIKTVKVE